MSLVTGTVIRPPNLNASSSSIPSQKLTKKQKKSLAFRERKTEKQNRDKKTAEACNTNDDDQYGLAEMDVNAIPAMEDQDLLGEASDNIQVEGVLGSEKRKLGKEKGGKGDKSQGKRSSKDGAEAVGVAAQVGKGKKRKREAEDVEAEVEDGVVGNGGKGRKRKKAAKKEDGEGEGEDDKTNQRFILFVGMAISFPSAP